MYRVESKDEKHSDELSKEEQKTHAKEAESVRDSFTWLTVHFMKQGASTTELQRIAIGPSDRKNGTTLKVQLIYFKKILFWTFLSSLLYGFLFESFGGGYMLGTRCLIPNNYLAWEFTRPVSNCDFCRDVDSALILPNLTRDDFAPYAYLSRPMIVKNAARHWQASKVFNLYFFKNLYESIDGAYESVTEECQFLHFKSNFASLKDVFSMSERRALNFPGEEPWYVGWKNCHPQVLEIMKRFYDTPHFLPEDAEVPNTNYVFLGFEQGATMHLDYISRLMWQGQILGSKTWQVVPTPECQDICKSFNFSVNAGDVILLDTRVWYHGTNVDDGQFSLTVTSEFDGGSFLGPRSWDHLFIHTFVQFLIFNLPIDLTIFVEKYVSHTYVLQVSTGFSDPSTLRKLENLVDEKESQIFHSVTTLKRNLFLRSAIENDNIQ